MNLLQKIVRNLLKKTKTFLAEKKEFYFVKRIARNSINIILDVGANQGQSTRTLHKLFPNAEIHSFEPDPETFLKLNKNCQKIRRANCYQHGFGKKNERRTLFVNKADENNTLCKIKKQHWKYMDGWLGFSNRKKTVIQIKTIDSWLKEKKIFQVDYLKIDTEGWDFFVLKGAEKSLASKRIRFVSIELFFVSLFQKQHSADEILKFMAKQNYKLVGIFNECRSSGGYIKWADLLFCSDAC